MNTGEPCPGCAETSLARKARNLKDSVNITRLEDGSMASVPVSMTSSEVLANLSPTAMNGESGAIENPEPVPEAVQRDRQTIPFRPRTDYPTQHRTTPLTMPGMMPAPLRQMLLPNVSIHYVLGPRGPMLVEMPPAVEIKDGDEPDWPEPGILGGSLKDGSGGRRRFILVDPDGGRSSEDTNDPYTSEDEKKQPNEKRKAVLKRKAAKGTNCAYVDALVLHYGIKACKAYEEKKDEDERVVDRVCKDEVAIKDGAIRYKDDDMGDVVMPCTWFIVPPASSNDKDPWTGNGFVDGGSIPLDEPDKWLKRLKDAGIEDEIKFIELTIQVEWYIFLYCDGAYVGVVGYMSGEIHIKMWLNKDTGNWDGGGVQGIGVSGLDNWKWHPAKPGEPPGGKGWHKFKSDDLPQWIKDLKKKDLQKGNEAEKAWKKKYKDKGPADPKPTAKGPGTG